MAIRDRFREFYLQRNEDESGISGEGIVARGVIFPSGKVVMEWQTFHSSMGSFDNIDDVIAIHGHDGKTLVIMGSPHSKSKKDRVILNDKKKVEAGEL